MASFDKKQIKSKGKLYGIGIGPGDPELLTLKAAKVLKRVDTIFAPRSSALSDSFAYRILKDYIPVNKVKTIIFPMSRNKKILNEFWEKSARKVYDEISRGRDAAFITIGDPFIYSTYAYLLKSIKKIDQNIDICTVPGISVVNAIASLFNVPLAEGNEKFVVTPMPKKFSELGKLLMEFNTVVLLKVGKRLKKLVNYLRNHGYAGSTYFAKKIGCPGQILIDDLTKLDFDETTLGYMSTILIRAKRRRKN